MKRPPTHYLVDVLARDEAGGLNRYDRVKVKHGETYKPRGNSQHGHDIAWKDRPAHSKTVARKIVAREYPTSMGFSIGRVRAVA